MVHDGKRRADERPRLASGYSGAVGLVDRMRNRTLVLPAMNDAW